MGELPPIETNCHVTIDIPMTTRVPTQVRVGKTRIYDPVLVSLGPFHRRDSRFRQMEDLKDDIVAELFSGGGGEQNLLEEVRSRIGEVRIFYDVMVGDSGVDDEALARMMLRDASFVVYCMRKMADHDGGDCTVLRRLGVSRLAFVFRDFFMLENQLPFFVLKKAVLLTRGGGGGGEESTDEFFYSKLTSILYCCDPGGRDPPPEKIPNFDKTLHLLDASQRLLLVPSPDLDLVTYSVTGHEPTPQLIYNNMFRSATDLMAKGIHFRPSSQSLTDISFFSYSTHGQLHLPVFRITDASRVLLSNLVAYELTSGMDPGVIRYVGFMKTLLRGEEDVELLREKGILYSLLSNEEVVSLFKDIDTCVAINPARLNSVKMRIEEHCKNKGKTWLAELINTYFRSPLTALALFAAAFILALTFLQTFYTINPRYANAAP